jgi:hypothetical protein
MGNKVRIAIFGVLGMLILFAFVSECARADGSDYGGPGGSYDPSFYVENQGNVSSKLNVNGVEVGNVFHDVVGARLYYERTDCGECEKNNDPRGPVNVKNTGDIRGSLTVNDSDIRKGVSSSISGASVIILNKD